MRRSKQENLWWRLVATLMSKSWAVFVCCVLWVCFGLCVCGVGVGVGVSCRRSVFSSCPFWFFSSCRHAPLKRAVSRCTKSEKKQFQDAPKVESKQFQDAEKVKTQRTQGHFFTCFFVVLCWCLIISISIN